MGPPLGGLLLFASPEMKGHMRRFLLGSLMFAALVAASSAFAVEARPAAADTPSAVPAKQAASVKPKRRPMPLSAAAREATRSIELPVAPPHSGTPSSAQHSWTGTYVGTGAGADR
jgi:hypothetical protein